MKYLTNIELIIFDLDGTLINSIPDLTDAMNHVANMKNHEPFSEKQVGGFVGEGVTQLIEKAFKIEKSDASFNDYFNQFLKYYEAHHSNRSRLFDGVVDTLNHLYPIKMAVLSNKLQPFTRQIVKDFGLHKYFEMVVGANVKLKMKPSGQPVQFILNQVGVSPEKAVMVGDSEPDIMAAKNAGINSIAVTYGYRSEKNLKALQPDFLISRFNQLNEIIRKA